MKKKKYIWMQVTSDKYELPVSIADSSLKLARMCGIKNAVAVIGGSMGGMQALCYAIEHPTFAKHYIPMATVSIFSI